MSTDKTQCGGDGGEIQSCFAAVSERKTVQGSGQSCGTQLPAETAAFGGTFAGTHNLAQARSKPAVEVVPPKACVWLFTLPPWAWEVIGGSKPSAFCITFIRHHLTLSVPIKPCEAHVR